MKKKLFKTMVAGVLSLAIVGTSFSMPFTGMKQVNAETNYENGHEYGTTSLTVGGTSEFTFGSNKMNSGDFGNYLSTEDENLDSDYLKIPMDRASYIAAYKTYNPNRDVSYYEQNADAFFYYTFSMNGESYRCNFDVATQNYAYYKKTINPNISYTFASASPAVVVVPDKVEAGEFAKSAVITGASSTGNKYVTVSATRTNARTGVSTTVYKYVEVLDATYDISGIQDSIINAKPVCTFDDMTSADADQFITGIERNQLEKYITNDAKDAAYVLATSNPAVAAIKTLSEKSMNYTTNVEETKNFVYNTYKTGDYDSNTSKNSLAVELVGVGTADLTITEYLPSGATRVIGTIKVIVNNDDVKYETTAANAKLAIGQTYNAFQFYNSTQYTNSAKYSVSKLSKKQKKIMSLDTKTGLVTAKKAGSVTLKVKMTYANGKNTVASKVATLKITVMKPAIDADAKALTLNVKDTYKVPIAYKNLKASYSYKSDKGSVAKVNKYGIITAKKAGDATITVTQKIKKKKSKIGTLTVHVNKPVEDTLAFNSDLYSRANGKASQSAMMSVNKGVKFDLNSYIDPDTASGTDGLKLTFKSSKKSVAKVSKSTGIVTAKKNGKATITVKSGKAKAKLTLYVVAPKNNSADDAQINAAAAAFSKLYGAQEVNTFKKASKLYSRYYNAAATKAGRQVLNGDYLSTGSVYGSDVDVNNNNYVQFPNSGALSEAQSALNHYFTQVNANYAKASNFKVTGLKGTTATITFNNKLTKNDVLQYCYVSNKPYSKSAQVAYNVTVDASNYQYMTKPYIQTGAHTVKDAAGKEITVYDMYAKNAAGQYVDRTYSDYNDLTGAYGKITETVLQPEYVNIGGSEVSGVAYRKAGSKKATLTLTKNVAIYNAYGYEVKDATNDDYIEEVKTRTLCAQFGLPVPADNVKYALSPATVAANVSINVNGTKIGTVATTYAR